MATITINVSDQFLPVMDELVLQTGAGSRENYTRIVLGNDLIDHQMRKEFGTNMQARSQHQATETNRRTRLRASPLASFFR